MIVLFKANPDNNPSLCQVAASGARVTARRSSPLLAHTRTPLGRRMNHTYLDPTPAKPCAAVRQWSAPCSQGQGLSYLICHTCSSPFSEVAEHNQGKPLGSSDSCLQSFPTRLRLPFAFWGSLWLIAPMVLGSNQGLGDSRVDFLFVLLFVMTRLETSLMYYLSLMTYKDT